MVGYPITSTPAVFVDHEGLSQMAARIDRPGTKALLLGFGEYAKHLVNLYGQYVSAVVDPRDWMDGITYKGVTVTLPDTLHEINLIIVCEYKHSYEFLARIVKLYPAIPYFIPGRIDGRITNEIDVFEQESIYQKLFEPGHEIPVSMMQMPKIKFLMELLRYGLLFPGDVLETGSWQGGSTWYMARMLALLNENRNLYAMDLFETHMIDPTATMCTDEIDRRLKQQHPKTKLLVGLVDSAENLAVIEGNLCFAHVDLGPIQGSLEFIWERLHLGAPLLLDNYGHIGAPTWEFDDFFSARGARVIRFPWSEQGLVFKH